MTLLDSSRSGFTSRPAPKQNCDLLKMKLYPSILGKWLIAYYCIISQGLNRNICAWQGQHPWPGFAAKGTCFAVLRSFNAAIAAASWIFPTRPAMDRLPHRDIGVVLRHSSRFLSLTSSSFTCS
jgi:hypothetical protein